MKKSYFVIVLALTLAWMILIESFSLVGLFSGLFIGACCIYFSVRFLPLAKIQNVDFNKLITYPFFLLGQIFLSATYVSKIIFKGAKIDIVDVETKIENDSIRVMLADSITLTPGSVMLDLDEGKMVILWLRQKGSPDVEDMESHEIAEYIAGKLESKLTKVRGEDRWMLL